MLLKTDLASVLPSGIGVGGLVRSRGIRWKPEQSVGQSSKQAVLLLTPGSSFLGIPAQATLAALHRNNTWMIPPARSETHVAVHALLTTIALTDLEDYLVSLCVEQERDSPT